MIKKVKKANIKKDNTGLDVIGLRIGGKPLAIYKGLGGTFDSFMDSCLRKQVLPGFHETGLIAEAEPKEAGIFLRLSGKHSKKKLKEIMDIALLNTGAYPVEEIAAGYFIEVESVK